jgi:hypothetical protein
VTVYQEKTDQPAHDDTFEMRTFLRAVQQANQKAPLRRLRSLIRISRDGGLREINAELHIAVKNWECRFAVDGPLFEGQLLPRWRIQIYAADDETEARVFDRFAEHEPTLIRELELPFPPLKFAGHGIVFNPLHPPNRLDVLKPNQHWRMLFAGNVLVLESLGVALHSLSEDGRFDSQIEHVRNTLGAALADVPMLEASVLPQTEPLPPSPLNESPDVPELRPSQQAKSRDAIPRLCWIIDAHDKHELVHARIWVQQSEGEHKGLVLRQETVFTTDHGEDVWLVHRELPFSGH